MPAIKPRRRTKRSQPPWESEGSWHEEDEEPSATKAGGSEGSNESGGTDGDEELPASQAPRRTAMTIQPRWRMMQHLPPRKKTGRRTTGGASGCSDTTPTGSLTSGMSIKLLWKTPCLPISITIVGEIASAPLLS